ncbi:hypothetical protein ASE39_19515 [Acidovorax sp. Root267]|nr:hypothetical protein ASE39_19515 [Acidovorax sp. Root267]
MALASSMAAVAATAPASASGTEPAVETVFTRARLVSIHQERGGRVYVRLKLLPRAKLPFTTQTFRVLDQAHLDGISEGSWVKFTTRSIDGENTLTSIHVVEECRRFQACD